MVYATATDVQTSLGRELDAAEVDMVNRRLAQAERLILKRIPDLAEKIADGDLDLDDVIDVEAEAVLRLVRNPEGYVAEGDGQYNYRINPDDKPGQLHITDDEWQALGARPRGRMFALCPTVNNWGGRIV